MDPTKPILGIYPLIQISTVTHLTITLNAPNP
jgi:hypothetical protein